MRVKFKILANNVVEIMSEDQDNTYVVVVENAGVLEVLVSTPDQTPLEVRGSI